MIVLKDINFYLHCFKNLRRDRKKGGAPHKPILLISLIQLFEIGQPISNKIFITPEIVSLFKSNWSNLVKSDHQMIFALPFYHMKSELFWRLIANQGCEKWVEAKTAMRSFANLNVAVHHAEIDLELYVLLKEKNNRDIFIEFLLHEYFYENQQNYQFEEKDDIFHRISKEIIEESPEEYKHRLKVLENTLDKNAFEEEIFVRSNVFKREVIKIYDNTCCITGLRIDTTINASILDACHIVPFSISHNDTITNGFALCPNMHRAFDRGLISIDDNYCVITSKVFTEPKKSVYSLSQFEGQQILLPCEKRFYPLQNNFDWHRKEFGF